MLALVEEYKRYFFMENCLYCILITQINYLIYCTNEKHVNIEVVWSYLK